MMGDTVNHFFNCDACGKRFKWTAAIAGKKAKCVCGQIVHVPASLDADESADDIYDIQDDTPAAEKPRTPTVTPAMRAPQAATHPALSAPAAPTLAYSRTSKADKQAARATADVLTNPVRDIYVPTAMFIVGVVLIVAHLLLSRQFDGEQIAAVLLVFAGLVAFKTVAMVLSAFVVASVVGTSFGLFWHAVLKLAAMVVFSFGVIAWIPCLAGFGGFMGILMSVLIRGAFYGLQLKLLFDIDTDEIMKVGSVFAVLDKLFDWISVGIIRSLLSG
jgi:hypothetical protein